jgi:hypothetical protein
MCASYFIAVALFANTNPHGGRIMYLGIGNVNPYHVRIFASSDSPENIHNIFTRQDKTVGFPCFAGTRKNLCILHKNDDFHPFAPEPPRLRIASMQ